MEKMEWLKLAKNEKEKIKKKIKKANVMAIENKESVDDIFVLLNKDGKVWIEEADRDEEMEIILKNKWDFAWGEYSECYKDENEIEALIIHLIDAKHSTTDYFYNQALIEIENRRR